MTRQSAKIGGLAALLLCLLFGDARAQIYIPEANPPVCVLEFCGPGSRHPNMQIPCGSSGCECDDSCGGGSTTGERRERSGGGGGNGALGEAAARILVGVAKGMFILLAPGHASEAFSKTPSGGAAAAEQAWHDQVNGQEARAQHGKDLAVELMALREFSRAIRERETNPQRYLRPLFQPTNIGPRMNVRDPLQQLRCVGAAMNSAEAAVASGIPGDIGFLDARRAVDISAGAWDSGMAPAECGGPTIHDSLAEGRERQRRLGELEAQLRTVMTAQTEFSTAQTQLDSYKKLDEQKKKLTAAEQAANQAKKEAEANLAAVEKQLKAEAASAPPPPPATPTPVAPVAPAAPSVPTAPATPPASEPAKPQSDLLARLLRAKAQSDAQLATANQGIDQLKVDIAAATKTYESEAATRLKPEQEKRDAALAAVNQNLEHLGLSPINLQGAP